jgi:hypothetical protein
VFWPYPDVTGGLRANKFEGDCRDELTELVNLLLGRALAFDGAVGLEDAWTEAASRDLSCSDVFRILDSGSGTGEFRLEGPS